jgi:hypothetical protein
MNTETLQDTILAIVTNDTNTYTHPDEYLPLFDLRKRLTELKGTSHSRTAVDAALLALHLSGKAFLQVEEGFRFLALHPEYAEAGVRVGDEIRHLIYLPR